jgi:hypothetical protein
VKNVDDRAGEADPRCKVQILPGAYFLIIGYMKRITILNGDDWVIIQGKNESEVLYEGHPPRLNEWEYILKGFGITVTHKTGHFTDDGDFVGDDEV